MAVTNLTERGCVVLDQPQRVGWRGAKLFSNTPLAAMLLRLVFNTAALRLSPSN